MLADLVQVTTSDGVRLHGALHVPRVSADRTSRNADLLLCVHGAGGNFYASPPFARLTELLVERGLATLRVNTRGHDALSGVTTGRARRRQGAAAEIVDECRLDLQAWVAFANEQGFRRVVPVGHSLGAVKVIYALANHPPLAAARAIAVSPPCLSYAKFMDSPRREEFLANLARAEAAIANGRPEELLEVQFPIPMLISASSYVDKYGPQERYNILRYLKHVACPLVITFGGLELQDGPAFAGLPEAIAGLGLSGMVQTAIVPGANHFYAGSVEPLARQIVDWLADEPRKP